MPVHVNQTTMLHTYTHPLISCGERRHGTTSKMNITTPLHFEWSDDREETTPDETEES